MPTERLFTRGEADVALLAIAHMNRAQDKIDAFRAEVERLTAIVQNSHPHTWHPITQTYVRCHICGITMSYDANDAN